METTQDAALVLVGHGSTVNADSSVPVKRLVEAFRRKRCFARVQAGFCREGPPLSGMLKGITEERVFVVPFFISEGYFSEEVVPRELGFRQEGQKQFDRVVRRGRQTLFYCKPVGTHDRMTDVVLSRARTVVESHPFPRKPSEAETTLFIAGHGTERNSASRRSVERQAEVIRQGGVYAAVLATFMEEEPRIALCWNLANTPNIVIVPFFLSDGMHVSEDIPVLLGAPSRAVRDRLARGQSPWKNPTQRHGKQTWYSGAVGSDPVIADVILEQVRQAASSE